VLLVALAAGCSDDPGDEGATGSTTSVTALDPTGAASTTTTTLSDAAFTAQLAAAEQSLDDAGTDECRLMDLGAELVELPAPAAPQQVRGTVALIARYLRAIAESVGGERPESVAKLRNSATAIERQAEAAAFAPAVLNSDQSLAAFRSRSYREAMVDLNQHAEARCRGTSTTRS